MVANTNALCPFCRSGYSHIGMSITRSLLRVAMFGVVHHLLATEDPCGFVFPKVHTDGSAFSVEFVDRDFQYCTPGVEDLLGLRPGDYERTFARRSAMTFSKNGELVDIREAGPPLGYVYELRNWVEGRMRVYRDSVSHDYRFNSYDNSWFFLDTPHGPDAFRPSVLVGHCLLRQQVEYPWGTGTRCSLAADTTEKLDLPWPENVETCQLAVDKDAVHVAGIPVELTDNSVRCSTKLVLYTFSRRPLILRLKVEVGSYHPNARVKCTEILGYCSGYLVAYIGMPGAGGGVEPSQADLVLVAYEPTKGTARKACVLQGIRADTHVSIGVLGDTLLIAYHDYWSSADSRASVRTVFMDVSKLAFR